MARSCRPRGANRTRAKLPTLFLVVLGVVVFFKVQTGFIAQASSRGERRLLRKPASSSRMSQAATAESGDSLDHAPDGRRIVVFTRLGCPFCTKAKAFLRRQGLSFDVVDTTAEPHRREEAKQLAGQAKTLPQIFVGQQSVGGWDELKQLSDTGELDKLLKAKPEAAGSEKVIAPTPTELLGGTSLVPEKARQGLMERGSILQQTDHKPGSQPSIRSFLKYAVTGMPSQGQEGNVPLNLIGKPGEVDWKPLLPDMKLMDVAKLLANLQLQLLDDFSDPFTGDVDYLAMRDSDGWRNAKVIAAEIGDPRFRDDLLAMSDAARKAFFINLYNLMTFHGVLAYGRRGQLWNMYCFYIAPSVTYLVAGEPFSLDDIENGVLRARPGYFKEPKQELQRLVRQPKADARIHMALNCGARGCPPVSIYSSEEVELEKELDDAAKAFLADDNVRVMPTSGTPAKLEVEVTELFKMYLMDFSHEGAKPNDPKDQQELLRWLQPFLGESPRNAIRAALETERPDIKVKWLPYNWETNGDELPLESRVYRPTW